MAHNYYLYESGGKLNLIPWDYNLAFGGMGRGDDASDVINSPIDDAFSATDFFDTLMADETYHSQYYEYLRQLVKEYVDGGGFDAFYARVRSQIDALVETDPTAFYSYDEYQTAVDTLYQVVKLRGESIEGQLDGTIPSTESAQRTSDALVDASALDISVMGYMNTGGGFRAQETPGNAAEEEAPESPADFGPPQLGTENQIPVDGPQQTEENAPDRTTGRQPAAGDLPGGSSGGTAQTASADNLRLYGVSALVLAAAMLVALLYRRNPRRRRKT